MTAAMMIANTLVGMLIGLMLAYGRMKWKLGLAKAAEIRAQAELEWAKRCDPMNANFHPAPTPPKSLAFWRKN